MKILRVVLFASFTIGAVSISPRPHAGVYVSLRSNAFIDRGQIPAAYTCDGDGQSPDLEWTWIPDNARSIVIVLDDFSADVDQSLLWAVWNLSPSLRELMESSRGGGGVEGMNDYKRAGYAPPCPPRGEMHWYGFRLFALDAVLSLDPTTATKVDLERAMDMHVVAGGTLMVSYTRPYE
jgi:Raf kinase inhibitor-like YbhB/YbcL family protein